MRLLSQCSVDSHAVITAIHAKDAFQYRLFALGFRIGQTVHLIRQCGTHGPLHVRLGTTDIVLRAREAVHIEVDDMKRIALLGMPNTGKSTLFNRISGASARVGNWPGITVDLLHARLLLGNDMVECVDLPGIYDLQGFSDDEAVVRQFLTTMPIDMVWGGCQ